MHGYKAWPNWIGGVVALAALAVDASMQHLLGNGFVFEAVVLGAVWLPAAVFTLAHITPGAWLRAPRLFAGIAVAHPVARSLGFDVLHGNVLLIAAVMAISFLALVVPMDRVLARLDARRRE
jgi:hypothetical protein